MDFKEIKKWFADPSERFVFIEDGKPAYVFLGFETYQALRGRKPEHAPKMETARSSELGVEMVNAHLEAERVKTKEELAAKLAMEAPKPMIPASRVAEDLSRIRLEDLPL